MQLANIAPEPADSIAGSLCDLQSLLIALHVNSEFSNAEINTHSHVSDSTPLKDVVEQLTRLADSLSHVGLTGLQNVQLRLIERLLPFTSTDDTASLAESLEEWVQLNFSYLAEPSELAHSRALIEFLNRSLWRETMTPGQMAIIERLFEMSLPVAVSLPSVETTTIQPIIDAEAALIISNTLDAITNTSVSLMLGDIAPATDASDDQHVVSSPEDVLGAELSPAVTELVTMIRDELAGCMDTLHALLETAATEALANTQPSFADYRWQVERLASASEALGLHGLHEFLARILEAACLMESALPNELPAHCEMLDRWPTIVTTYLEHVGSERAAQALIDYITSVDFALPLETDAAASLRDQLVSPHIELPSAATEPRITTATPDDVSLVVPNDIAVELLESLLHELPAQTQEFSTALQHIASGAGHFAELQIAQRIAHTLKGSANTVGIRGIAQIAHHLEDIFLALSQHNVLPPPALSRVLVDAADCLEAMSDALLGTSPAPEQALSVLQAVLDWANRIDREGVAALQSTDVASPASHSDAPVAASDNIEATVRMPVLREHDVSIAPVAQEPVALADASNAPTLRVPTTHIDDLLRLSGESKIIGGQLKEGLRRVESHLHAVRRQHQLFQQLVGELEQLVDIRGISMPLMNRTGNASGDFDALEMDQYSELHTVSRRLTEAATDSREWSSAAQGELASLEDMLRNQTRHGNETQESILKMRMVPASSIVGRLQRGVRQTCRLLDKDVELEVKGADTLIDSDNLNQLVDPLMHLMRNAIDHGIESADVRAAHGKSSKGRLSIEFGREGNQIVVRCIDDGQGLNYAAIRATAEARGMIDADTVLTNAQLGQLILQPGFSTRNDVTQISGRGIGLDIVHSRVLELKGSLDVQSESFRGCRFLIRLPATLISAHALLVRHGKHTVAIASRGVRQILDAHAGVVSMLANRLSLQVGSQVYEAHRLETLLGHAHDRRGEERAPRPALLVEVGNDRVCAILVQGVVDTIDLVVKPLGPFVPRSVGLIGATILGDGSVAPVMDIPELLRASGDKRFTVGASNNRKQAVSAPSNLPSVLVVDDSLSVRRAMEQMLKDAGYDVRLARDGLEAVSILEAKKPDILLVDLEMPRMNGMELTVHVRNRAETRDLPVIMITSRATEKHRKQAESSGVNHYMTKPYAEDALLEHMNTLLKQRA